MALKDPIKRKEYLRKYYLKNRSKFLKKSKNRYREEREQIIKYQKTRYSQKKEEILEVNRRWRLKNKKKKADLDKTYYLKNIEKIKKYKSAWDKEWRKNNKGIKNANTAKRYAALIKRTPKYADMEKIKEIYIKAEKLTQDTGVSHHVDHIIPLQGESVCGFHHENNLRVITAEENMKKGSRFNPTIQAIVEHTG